MGSAVLNKSPSSFLAFVYGFLLISFLLNIPHAQGAVRVYSGRSRSLGVNDGASRVGAPPARHDSNAQRRPPKQSSSPLRDTSTGGNHRYVSYGAIRYNSVPCSRRGSYSADCRPSVNPRQNPKNESPLYSWIWRKGRH